MQHDLGNALTEQLLERLERRIVAVYLEARNDLERVIEEYFTQFAVRDAEQAALVAAGKLEEAAYILWRLNQIGRGKRFEALRDKVAERVTSANEYAVDYINAATPSIYALNRNYTAYTVDKLTGGAFTLDYSTKLGIDFTLWDENTVRRLIVEQPDLMPHYPEERAVKRGIDLAYGKKQITAQVTSSILSGDSVKHMADKLQQRIVDMNRSSAIRAARTATTGAQNAGRQDGYVEAAKLGINVRKRWIAAKDTRTRADHGAADGQVVDYDKPFDVGGEKLMFPGDPSGSPRNLYNCRCTMCTVEKDGIEAEPRMMRVRNADGRNVVVPEMTYSEWKEWVGSKQGVDNLNDRGIIESRNFAMGFRKPVSHILDEREIEAIISDAKSLSIPISILSFNTGRRTGFLDSTGIINVRGDILPDTTSKIARDCMSSKAVLAHEYYGHMQHHPSEFSIGDWRDEYRASRSAAIDAPNLSDEDRALLMIDAFDRMREAGEIVEYDEEARRIIHGN